MCTQKSGGHEDCLYLDVYTPERSRSLPSQVTLNSTHCTSGHLPVMVWIHGGGYVVGSKNGGKQSFAAQGVVVVSINYRLGPFGFLSTQDGNIPGNFGMLDQVAALKWVQDNIAAFGGCPKQVTIAGSSAGAASVANHRLSPLSRGLFHRTIQHSGSASASRATHHPALPVSPRDVAIAASEELGCGKTPNAEFLSCLQAVNPTTFAEACMKASQLDKSSGPFRPIHSDAFGFLPDFQLRLRERGEFSDVPGMRGFCSQESGNEKLDMDGNGVTVEEFRRWATAQLKDFPYLNSSYVSRLENVYLTGFPDDFRIRDETVQMRSEMTFILPIVRETQAYSAQVPETWMFQFDYRKSNSPKPDWVGATHGTDVPFAMGYINPNTGDATDVIVSKTMQKMWVNFVTFGNPTPSDQQDLVQWKPFTVSEPSTLLIDGNFQVKTYNSAEELAHLEFFKETERGYLAALGDTTTAKPTTTDACEAYNPQ